jgi:SAM-dependent methyltransferase/GNAT superfamily N-acetyltransferase
MGSGTDAVIASARGASGSGAAASVGYSTWSGSLMGGTVTATPSEKDANGKAQWTVTVQRADGSSATTQVWLSTQFSAAQLTQGSAAKSALEQQLNPPRGADEVQALKQALQGASAGGLSATDVKLALDRARGALDAGQVTGNNVTYLRDLMGQAERKLDGAREQDSAKAAATVQTLGAAIRAFGQGADRQRLNDALAAARSVPQTGWSAAQKAELASYEHQAAARLGAPAAKGASEVQTLKQALRDVGSGGLTATDLKLAYDRAQQALGNGQVSGNNVTYLKDLMAQAQRKLDGAQDDGTAQINRLGQAIRAFDRGGSRESLNAALSAARSAAKGGWSNGALANLKTLDGQASSRLWPKARADLTPGERAMVQDSKAKARENLGQRENNALYEANQIAARVSGGQVTNLGQVVWRQRWLTDSNLNIELNAVALRHGFDNWHQLLSPNLRRTATERLTPTVPGTRPAASAGDNGGATQTKVQALVDQRLQQLVAGTKFEGKVHNVRELASYGDKEVPALLAQLDQVARAGSSGRTGLKELMGPLPAAPVKNNLNRAFAQSTKPLRQRIDLYSAELSEHEKQWADLSRSKINGQVLVDGIRNLFGQDGDGFKLFQDTRSRLDHIQQDVMDRKISVDEGQRRVKTLMDGFRAENQQRIHQFGSSAQAAVAVVEPARAIAPSLAGGVAYVKTLALTGGNANAAASVASGVSFGTRELQDFAGRDMVGWYNNRVRQGGPDKDLQRIVEQQPSALDPRRIGSNALSAAADGLAPWAMTKASIVVTPLMGTAATKLAPLLRPALAPLTRLTAPLVNAAKPVLTRIGRVLTPADVELGLQLPATLEEGLQHAFGSALAVPAGSVAGLAPNVANTKLQGEFQKSDVQQAITQLQAQHPAQRDKALLQTRQQWQQQKKDWIARERGAFEQQVKALGPGLDPQRVAQARQQQYKLINDTAYARFESGKNAALQAQGRQLEGVYQLRLGQLQDSQAQIADATDKAIADQSVFTVVNLPLDAAAGGLLGIVPPSARQIRGAAPGQLRLSPISYGAETLIGFGQGTGKALVGGWATNTPVSLQQALTEGLTSALQMPIANEAITRGQQLPGTMRFSTEPTVTPNRGNAGGSFPMPGTQPPVAALPRVSFEAPPPQRLLPSTPTNTPSRPLTVRARQAIDMFPFRLQTLERKVRAFGNGEITATELNAARTRADNVWRLASTNPGQFSIDNPPNGQALSPELRARYAETSRQADLARAQRLPPQQPAATTAATPALPADARALADFPGHLRDFQQQVQAFKDGRINASELSRAQDQAFKTWQRTFDGKLLPAGQAAAFTEAVRQADLARTENAGMTPPSMVTRPVPLETPAQPTPPPETTSAVTVEPSSRPIWKQRPGRLLSPLTQTDHSTSLVNLFGPSERAPTSLPFNLYGDIPSEARSFGGIEPMLDGEPMFSRENILRDDQQMTELTRERFGTRSPAFDALKKTVQVVTKFGKRALIIGGAVTVTLTSANTFRNLVPESRNTKFTSGSEELARVIADPNHIRNNYFDIAGNATGDLWKYTPPGASDPVYFRRVPLDIYESLFREEIVLQRQDLQKPGSIWRGEKLPDGRDIMVEIRPPYRHPSQWVLQQFKGTQDDTNPFNSVADRRLQIGGPEEGFHTALTFNTFAGTRTSDNESTAHVQFDPLTLKPDFVDFRQQVTTRLAAASVKLSPVSLALDGHQNLTHPNTSPVTNLDIGAVAGYVVFGARDRQFLKFDGKPPSATSRVTGLVEPGVMYFPVTFAGKGPQGTSWSVTPARAYFEPQLYVGDSRLNWTAGSGKGGRFKPFNWVGPDIAVEFHSRGVVPNIFSPTRWLEAATKPQPERPPVAVQATLSKATPSTAIGPYIAPRSTRLRETDVDPGDPRAGGKIIEPKPGIDPEDREPPSGSAPRTPDTPPRLPPQPPLQANPIDRFAQVYEQFQQGAIEDVSVLRNARRQALQTWQQMQAADVSSMTPTERARLTSQRERFVTTLRQTDIALAEIQGWDGRPVYARPPASAAVLSQPVRLGRSEHHGLVQPVLSFFDAQYGGHRLASERVGGRTSQARDWLAADATEVYVDASANVIAAAVGTMLNNGTMGSLELVAVAPEYRQQGLGRRVIESIEAQLAARGATRIQTIPAADSSVPERQLTAYYRSLGYEFPERSRGFLEKDLTSNAAQTPRSQDAVANTPALFQARALPPSVGSANRPSGNNGAYEKPLTGALSQATPTERGGDPLQPAVTDPPRQATDAQRTQWGNTAAELFVNDNFDAATATPEQTFTLLSDFAFDYSHLNVIARALETQRPDLFRPLMTRDGARLVNPAAMPLREILANEASGRTPEVLATAFEQRSWEQYYERTANNGLSLLLARGVTSYLRSGEPGPGVIVDLGAGAGVDARKMIDLGWQVVAVDPQPAAIEGLVKRVPEAKREQLTALQSTVEDAALPRNVDVVYAHRTLPHVAPANLSGVLDKAVAALRPGGYFIASFFGPQHRFAGRRDMNILSEAQIRNALPKNLEVVDLTSGRDGDVELIARKRGDDASDATVAEEAPTAIGSRPRNPLTPISQAIQAFGKTPLGKAVQLSPLLALTASGRLPPGVSFDAQVEQRVRDMAEQVLQKTQQQEVGTGQQQAPKDALPRPDNGTQTWSTVNQAQLDQPVTLQAPADPRDPTLIDHLNLGPRQPGRAYNDVLSIASKPFYGSSSVLFVPNAVTEQGVGIKGNGANPKDWGAGFFRGFNFTVQPLEVFASRTFPLDNARQSVQSSALRVQVSHAGGDYFSTGVHQTPTASGGLAVDNLFNSKRSVTRNFGEAFGNFPYAWTRPDTNTVGGRVIGQRGEIIFNAVEGLRRDNASTGQSIYQGGAPYSWAQDNVKFSLGTNPWSGYAYIGAQQELGVKIAGAGREQDAPGALPTSNWHLVSGKIVADSASNRAAWERSFDSSGLTLRSESLVPGIGEKTAAVFARVDDKLLAAGDMPLPVRTIDGKDYVRASDVHARLAATGRAVAGYDELAAVQPRQFVDINRGVSRMIDGEAFVAHDSWVRTGTVVAEGLPGLAVPKAYAQLPPSAVYSAPQTAFARSELPAQKPGLPTFGLRGVLDAPNNRTPPAPITPGQLANDAAQRTNWKIDGTSRAAQVVGIGAALRDVDTAQQHYEQLMREGKNWLQKNIDAGRDLVWGAPDAQIANFEQRRTELNALLGQVGEGLTRSAAASRVAPNTPRVRAELDRIEQRFKGEYRRVFDEQLRNAQIAQALWFASRGVVLSAAAAAALGAVTVGVKRNRLGPMLMGGVVGLTAASVFDAGSLLIGKTGPAGNSHFAPQIHLQSPGAYVMGRMTGDAPGDWGPAAQKGLQDLAQAAAITFGIRLRASLDKTLIETAEKHLGTTGAIGAVLSGGPKELLDGRGGAPFWIKGLSADALRFGGTAGMSLLQGLTGDLVNAGLRAAPAALFDPTRLYGGGDGKLAVAGRQVTAQVTDGLQRNLFRAGASGVTNVLNFRRSGEWFDGAANVFTTLLTGAAADQADGGIGRLSAATIAPEALAQTIENISARYVPKALDPERFVEPQSAAFYARKFGVPEHTIRFLITNRHGQSGANLLHVTAGNTVVAEAQPLGKQGLFDPSLHWLGRAAAQVRDHGLYGAAAKGVDKLKYTLAGVDAPRLASDEDAPSALQHPDSTDIGVIARQGNKAVTTPEMADALGLREPGESDADVQQRLDAAIREAAGQIWERQLSANSHGFDVKPETWENYNVPLTRQGQSQALRGQKTITALLGHLGDRPIDVSVSPVLRAKLTAQLLFGDAKATFPERFDGLGDMNVQIRWAEEPGARERGQGYLVYSAKVGVEFGKGESWLETLKTGSPAAWWKGVRKGVLDNLAGNMAWPPPSAAGKHGQIIEFSVPIRDHDGQVSLDTRNVRVRLRDATGYETSRQFDRRVKKQLLEGSILPTFKAGFDAANVSHQYTIAALMRELQSSRLNPLFKQDTKAVGAAVINGKPHMAVFYMDETGTPRLIEAGYVDAKWAAKQEVQRLQAVDVSGLDPNSPQRLAHETELVRAVAERDVLLDSPNAMRRLEAKHALDMRISSSTAAAFDHLQKLDVLRTALRRIDAWAPQETLRWNEDIQLARRLFPSRGAVPASLEPEALALRLSTLMSAFQPDVAGHARHNYSDTRRGLENLQREIAQAIANTSDVSLTARLEKVRDHVWYLYEQIGDPNDAPAQVHQWREGATRGRDVR